MKPHGMSRRTNICARINDKCNVPSPAAKAWDSLRGQEICQPLCEKKGQDRTHKHFYFSILSQMKRAYFLTFLT